jgi:hypothetical protein
VYLVVCHRYGVTDMGVDAGRTLSYHKLSFEFRLGGPVE